MAHAFTIRPETGADIDKIAALHMAAFGGDDVIPKLVADLRHLAAPLATISLVAEGAPGAIIGHIMLSHSWLDAPGAMVDVYCVSPLGVLPDKQRQGIGKTLMQAAIQAASQTQAPCVWLEGNPKYYSKLGFQPAKDHGFRRPSLRIPEAAFQVYALPGGSNLSGTLIYRDIFWQRDCVGLRP